MRTTYPGPWVVKGVGREKLRVESPKGEVCVIYNKGNEFDGSASQTRERNAHLIAAAPDLLEALKTLVARIEDGGAVKREGVTGAAYNVWMSNFSEDWCYEFNQAERAIAKAEGQ